jgi:hypothetical protein
MTDSNLTKQELHNLESLIDGAGIENVLIAISEICGMKAEHISEYWQDAHLAKRWATMSGAVGCIVPHGASLYGERTTRQWVHPLVAR